MSQWKAGFFSPIVQKRKSRREGRESGCFHCSKAASLQRVKTVNIKAGPGLERGKTEEEGS